MKFLVVLSCAVSACLAEAQKEAASTDQVSLAPLDPYYSPFSPLGLPVAPGAVSATNVNVPGKFSYVVNAVHPTRPETVSSPLASLAPEAVSDDLGAVSGLRISPLPAYPGLNGYNGFNGFNGYNGINLGYNNGLNPWAGAGYYGNYGLNNHLTYGGYPGYRAGYGLPYYG